MFCLFINLTSWGAIVFSLITAGRGWGLIFFKELFIYVILKLCAKFQFLLSLQLVKKFVVVWWLKPILVFSLAQAEQNVHVLLVKFFDWTAAQYAQWITKNYLQFMEQRGMNQTQRRFKVLWEIWKNEVNREYETLVIIEYTVRNPGGRAAYVVATKKAFAQMYGDVPWHNDVVAEPARMNWPRVIQNLANRMEGAAMWMINKMAACVSMIDADARERREINGLASLDVKVLTLMTTREDAILQRSAVMEETGTCMTHINEYYNMMPDVATELELSNLFIIAIGVEEAPNID